MELGSAQGVKRQCGFRQEGMPYVECGKSPFGQPVEYFLRCPPIILPFNLPPRGLHLFKREARPDQADIDGYIYHIMDHVGMEYQVADMIEEIKRYGLSRKASWNTKLDLLTKDSKIFLCHSEAYVIDMAQNFETWTCPSLRADVKAAHKPQEMKIEPESGMFGDCCGGFWWQNIRDGVPLSQHEINNMTRHFRMKYPNRPVLRKCASFSYIAAEAPEWAELEYFEAVFAVFPITNLSVVKHHEGKHKENLNQLAETAHIPVLEVLS